MDVDRNLCREFAYSRCHEDIRSLIKGIMFWNQFLLIYFNDDHICWDEMELLIFYILSLKLVPWDDETYVAYTNQKE